MHIKMYQLDQVTESLIVNCFEEGSAASKFAYEQFFTTLEQTVEELAKCFLLEFGENKELLLQEDAVRKVLQQSI